MNDTDEQKEKIITGLMEIYKQNFGESTAQLYLKFYADKDLKTILTSAKELMQETFGDAKGQEVFDMVNKQYNLEVQNE